MADKRIKDVYSPELREWEEFYRLRWQYDKIVRSTHGVNCTGSCSWMVYVKDGIVTWELQANDYPQFNPEVPNYEPRGCQRGVSFSWYIYSPLRVKYPYIRGALLELWREAKQRHSDPVEAWKSIVEDENLRKKYVSKRGMGGFRRASWDEAVEIIAASCLYTASKYGPDRVIGFTPIPAMSMVSYAAGARFLQLFGGVCMSFYDWYCDLPPASPQIWGEQTDVNESADWYNAGYIAVMGSNPSMTRTPDVHYLAEARYRGAKVAVLSPDYSQVSKYADLWLPVEPGHDAAFWMAVNHVIVKEFYADKTTDYFDDYCKRYTDLPFLVKLEKKGDALVPGRFLRASEIEKGEGLENAEWILCVMDGSGEVRIPNGSIGFRWSSQGGKWNLEMKDAVDGKEIDVKLTLLGGETATVRFHYEDYGDSLREVPVARVKTKQGEVLVATAFDLLVAHLGVSRGLGGDYPSGYEDDKPFTPKWQEKYTRLGAESVIKFAREWAENGEKTKGRNLVIIGAGANHWYHNDLIYRSCITALILTGSVGRNGGGLAHYVGQEKVVPIASWAVVAFAQDWGMKPPRLQNTPSFWYVHSDQWRYDRSYQDYFKPVLNGNLPKHTIDFNVKAVRLGWLPFYPQFNENPIKLVEAAKSAGAESDDDVKKWIIKRLKEGKLKFAIEDPDAKENSPKVWFIWRGNAVASSAKGHEFFLRHVIGAPNSNATAQEQAKDVVEEVVWREVAPEGKMDLIVDINFRMDTSAMYSDIILPTATWYEKNDINSTDLHSFINCLAEAVPPAWEAKSDWQAFKLIAKKVSELAQKHFPSPVKDVVMAPLLHDMPEEISQPEVKDWKKGEVEPIPGKTMPKLVILERDYVNLYKRYTSLGPGMKQVAGHGVGWDASDVYEALPEKLPSTEWNGSKYVSLEDEVTVADVILTFAPETNGEMSYRAFKSLEKKVGRPLADELAGPYRSYRITFHDTKVQPRRFLTSPVWSAVVNDGRTYSPYTLNVDYLVPWRTLSGRQEVYLDHEYYLSFYEALPTFKPKIDPKLLDELVEGDGIVLNFITPHSKWSIHSTYYDNLRMLTLSRGGQVLWINDKDAAEAGIKDNDWIEAYNANGVVVCRAIVTARLPRGMSLMYHAPERTLFIPKSARTGRRGGVHNSLTRTRLKPTLMVGGYAQFSYYFNYWGPTGVNRDTYIIVRKLKR
jgi:nitrate reductase alpha subunit